MWRDVEQNMHIICSLTSSRQVYVIVAVGSLTLRPCCDCSQCSVHYSICRRNSRHATQNTTQHAIKAYSNTFNTQMHTFHKDASQCIIPADIIHSKLLPSTRATIALPRACLWPRKITSVACASARPPCCVFSFSFAAVRACARYHAHSAF